jgi:hypothetical protein
VTEPTTSKEAEMHRNTPAKHWLAGILISVAVTAVGLAEPFVALAGVGGATGF